MRERGGRRTPPFLFQAEAEPAPTIRERVATGTTVHAGDAAAWDALHVPFDTKRIDHGIVFAD